MKSKERLEEIRKQLEKTCLKNCGHGSNENCICLNNQYANLEHLEKDLERLEKQDKILDILKEYLTLHILEELCIEEKEVWEWLGNEK